MLAPPRPLSSIGALVGLWLLGSSAPAGAEVLRLSLSEAVEAALVRSYAMRLAQVDRGVSEEQVREAFASFFPKVDASASYLRTFLTPNPFAGASAADLFSGLSTGDWVSFNERVRGGGDGLDAGAVAAACPGAVDGAGNLQTIPFAVYAGCIGQAQAGAGAIFDPDRNPFLVENTVRAGLTATQLLYSGAAFAAVEAAKHSGALSAAQLQRTAQQVASDTVAAYYRVSLARASVEVLENSVERTKETVREVGSRVKEGVLPQFQLLSVQVELANLETQLVGARDDAEAAEDQLAFAVGLPVQTSLILTDPLEVPASRAPPLPEEEAVVVALEQRPDLTAAERQVDLRRAAEAITAAQYFPELRLVVNLIAVGAFPDDRSRVFAEAPGEGALLPDNPFGFAREERGILDSSFWGTNFTAGLNLTWNLFEGFATAARQSQDQLEIARAKIQGEQIADSVRLEVARQRRALGSAEERLAVQAKNVERAELNYRHAKVRVREGVSSSIELREASQQLDQSRLGRLQAVHDYLVAWARFETALGQAPTVIAQENNDVAPR